MEVRQYGGQAGAALASDVDVTFTDSAAPTDAQPDRRLLLLEPSIAMADLADLPGQNQPDAGAVQRFEYEIMVIYADDKRDSLWVGDFIVTPGVVA